MAWLSASLVGGAFFLLLLVQGTVGWGDEGHYITCKLAEIKHSPNWRWSSALHFIDTPDFSCNYDFCRDCHDGYGNIGRCVIVGIYNYTMQLEPVNHNSLSAKKYNLTEALLFLSHFIGDVHQPLHAGFTGDLGGNRIKVRWYEKETNLHHVWDDMIVGTALTTFYDSDITNMIQYLRKNIADNWSNEISSWEKCTLNQTVCPDVYASESASLVCKYAYTNVTVGSNLADDYFLSRLPIVEKRLAQGGIRLATTLNVIFAPKTLATQRGRKEAALEFHMEQ